MTLNNWSDFCRKIAHGEIAGEQAAINEVKTRNRYYNIYPDSIHRFSDCYFFLFKDGLTKKLAILDKGNWPGYSTFKGEEIDFDGARLKMAPLTHENACSLRHHFTFTSPKPLGKQGISMGLGDRLGIASPGHIRCIKKTNVKPVLAQQSVRELTLTGRNFQELIDDASWAVFQENYQCGFGADGDHLKSKEEIAAALAAGCTMITLDCSEWIAHSILTALPGTIETAYHKLPWKMQEQFESLYLNHRFNVGDYEICFEELDFKRIALVYIKALNFIKEVYNELIVTQPVPVDFEVSIDETITPTSPAAHFFVAAELNRAGVKLNSLAPRFCGSFEKGIDYVGDIIQFEKELQVHSAIADYFGYKLSIHSGSDKFKVLPIIGHWTGGRVHLKTAGTNWLEALKIITRYNPDLFRKLYKYARVNLDEARKYYTVTINPDKLPEIDNFYSDNLEELLQQRDTRQMMHIAYGILLTARDESGKYLFRDAIYEVLLTREEDYYQAIEDHIGKHIAALKANL